MKYALTFLVALITANVTAQGNPAERIAPYLTDTAVAIARVDLQEIDLKADAETLETILGVIQQDPRLVETISRRLNRLKEQGFSELFLVADLAEVHDNYGYVVLPIPEGVEPPEKGNDDYELVIDNTLIFGSKRIIDHFHSEPTAGERPHLANAFGTFEGAPIQFVIAPSHDQRRILREMLPDLSGKFGDVTGAELADGFLWLSLGMRDTQALYLIIVTKSEDDAKALQQAIAATFRQLATNENLLGKIPNIAELAEKLTPKRDGASLKITAEQTSQVTADIVARTIAAAQADAKRRETTRNLKQLGLAMHNFHSTYESFPPSASYTADGKQLLSWRVFVLPWVEESDLYEQFHLNEPWDSEHNKKLIERMPDVFKSPRTPAKPGMTVFQVPTGEGLVFDGKVGIPLSKITDGTSNTILVVETTAEAAVPWTKPDDLEVDPKNPQAGLVEGRDGFWTTFCDGSARYLPSSIDSELLMRLFMAADGEVIGDF